MKPKRTDIVLLLFLIIFGIGLSICVYLPHTDSGNYVEVRINGETRQTYPLSLNRTEKITCPDGGSNQFQIQDGIVYMTEADCHDKICVGMHEISNPGETIVCLPHKLVLAITGTRKDAPEPDAITG